MARGQSFSGLLVGGGTAEYGYLFGRELFQNLCPDGDSGLGIIDDADCFGDDVADFAVGQYV